MKTYVILHNIRSAHNVGSIFRTSDGAGVSKIYISGYTPAPHDRFGRENQEILKTSLGATAMVPYESVNNIHDLVLRLKHEGVEVVAVEQTKSALSYTESIHAKDTAFIFGNEITGIEEQVLAYADSHIHIPMHGSKESLNVSVCVGIILFANRVRNEK